MNFPFGYEPAKIYTSYEELRLRAIAENKAKQIMRNYKLSLKYAKFRVINYLNKFGFATKLYIAKIP